MYLLVEEMRLNLFNPSIMMISKQHEIVNDIMDNILYQQIDLSICLNVQVKIVKPGTNK